MLAAHRVTGKPGNHAILPGDAPDDWSALLVCGDGIDAPWRIASQADTLPEGTYRLSAPVGAAGNREANVPGTCPGLSPELGP